MLTLRLYLEEMSGDWFGWIEDFPGATCQGTSPQDAQRAAPCALIDYVHWLRGHQERLPSILFDLTSADIQMHIAETHSAHPGAGIKTERCFEPDTTSLMDDEIEAYLRLLRYARADLEKATDALPPEAWDTAPFGGKSVRAILRHLAEVEMTTINRLRLLPAPPPVREPMEQLRQVRQEFEQAIRAFPADRRDSSTLIEGERWTLRKVLRRVLWHERYHAAQIDARSHPQSYLRAALREDRRQSEAHWVW